MIGCDKDKNDAGKRELRRTATMSSEVTSARPSRLTLEPAKSSVSIALAGRLRPGITLSVSLTTVLIASSV